MKRFMKRKSASFQMKRLCDFSVFSGQDCCCISIDPPWIMANDDTFWRAWSPLQSVRTFSIFHWELIKCQQVYKIAQSLHFNKMKRSCDFVNALAFHQFSMEYAKCSHVLKKRSRSSKRVIIRHSPWRIDKAVASYFLKRNRTITSFSRAISGWSSTFSAFLVCQFSCNFVRVGKWPLDS